MVLGGCEIRFIIFFPERNFLEGFFEVILHFTLEDRLTFFRLLYHIPPPVGPTGRVEETASEADSVQ